MSSRDECLFCMIADGTIPADVVYRDDDVLAFRDLHPVAPVHVLVIPFEHHGNIASLSDADPSLTAALLSGVAAVARAEGLAERGWRTVFNTGPDAGQTVFHVHAHVLGGAPQGWPHGGA